jgi:hypothetical protein
MPPFLGIWDTEDCLEVGPTKLLIISNVATTGGYRFCCESERWQSATAMAKKAKKAPFDPKVFLATVNGGRSISKYRMNQKVFTQGSSADAVFYIQKGKVKITVTSEQGKEAVVVHEERAFSEMFVSHLLARTSRVEADLVDQLFNSSEKRLARALLLLANFGQRLTTSGPTAAGQPNKSQLHAISRQKCLKCFLAWRSPLPYEYSLRRKDR